MSTFPDFTKIDFAEVPAPAAPKGEAWNTPEGVAVAPAKVVQQLFYRVSGEQPYDILWPCEFP